MSRPRPPSPSAACWGVEAEAADGRPQQVPSSFLPAESAALCGHTQLTHNLLITAFNGAAPRLGTLHVGSGHAGLAPMQQTAVQPFPGPTPPHDYTGLVPPSVSMPGEAPPALPSQLTTLPLNNPLLNSALAVHELPAHIRQLYEDPRLVVATEDVEPVSVGGIQKVLSASSHLRAVKHLRGLLWAGKCGAPGTRGGEKGLRAHSWGWHLGQRASQCRGTRQGGGGRGALG